MALAASWAASDVSNRIDATVSTAGAEGRDAARALAARGALAAGAAFPGATLVAAGFFAFAAGFVPPFAPAFGARAVTGFTASRDEEGAAARGLAARGFFAEAPT